MKTPGLFQSFRSVAIKISRRVIGWPPAPMGAAEKHALIISLAGQNQAYSLVETGTFKGDTLAATKEYFSSLYSIELSEELFLNAVRRFEHEPKIKLFMGDSGTILLDVLHEISTPVIYWLDGHYSGSGTAMAGNIQCPIIDELNTIFKRANISDVILIDDARLFGWRNGYPKLQIIRELVHKEFPSHSLSIIKDVLAIRPVNQ